MPAETRARPLRINELQPDSSYAPWRRKLYRIIFEADTPAGKLFDVALLVLIVLSLVVVCLETLMEQGGRLPESRKIWFLAVEWTITLAFTIEYAARIISVRRPRRYIFSFFGVVDLLSILPTYLAAIMYASTSSLVVLRAVRLLRVFRILKLVWLVDEAHELGDAIWRARGKVLVFLCVVAVSITISGAVMYELECEANPAQFSSLPASMYWAVVTMTTVGYGDMVPVTAAGKAFSSLLILLGYSLIIVPTGFVSAEFIRSQRKHEVTTRVCDHCMSEGHDRDAVYCKYCGGELLPYAESEGGAPA